MRSKWFVAGTGIDTTGISQLSQNVEAAEVVPDRAVYIAIDEIHHRYPARAA